MSGGDWYDNKALYEMIQGLREDLQTTRAIIKKYNGIRSDLIELKERLMKIEERQVGRSQTGEKIQRWGGWLVAILSLFVLILNMI
ncbi:MAG: hypothetical protein ACOC4G_14760 [Bacillota bacterium]